ncbi:7-dehydrocholesterol reductase [Candidatus Protochlamydia phocaeensis]|uniref:7-dehydrocholesterol reductase n=1 Tax=Candidatus Protochlamydia phocaeensis TaxID=1414722 RepID=UPI00083870B6|nr:7-dehydrocholesterol reductase [Candidatus Protochlamydia phocaeensis]
MVSDRLLINKQTQYFRQFIGPLFLILVCPPAVFAFWYTNVFLDGSFLRFGQFVTEQGLWKTFSTIWFPYFFGTPEAWKILGVFAGFELALMRLLPGKRYEGPITPAGNIPLYRANGLPAFAITLFMFITCSFYLKLFSPTIIYDHFGGLLGALNIFSLFFCLFLWMKGHFFPSSSDVGGSGNFIFDYYWGMELYPRIFGWDVKMFTNCRFAMMGWPLIILSFASKQQELYGLSDSMVVSIALQLIYITKFFIWETGYLRSLDIMHDRAGYYICWGCLVWVPGIYTSPTLYLVNHPVHLGPVLASLIFGVGAASILINYWADRQRQIVRASAGQCTIWGKPPLLTVARYTTERGERKQNVLLASGWWGLSRHFHYIPEIVGAFCWTVPALFHHFLPYFYVLFLTILLAERAFRDDRRCAKKYGDDWQAYCQKVPYKIIPYVI